MQLSILKIYYKWFYEVSLSSIKYMQPFASFRRCVNSLVRGSIRQKYLNNEKTFCSLFN